MRFYRGDIDEVEVFSRALTQAEILLIVRAGQEGKCWPYPWPIPTPTPGQGP